MWSDKPPGESAEEIAKREAKLAMFRKLYGGRRPGDSPEQGDPNHKLAPEALKAFHDDCAAAGQFTAAYEAEADRQEKETPTAA
jgi:hypothetical protein